MKRPERDYDIISIPGRSGDIVIDKGSYKNVDKTYYLAMANGKSLPEMSKTIMNWLLGPSGYVRLEDSYEPGYFRYAMYKGPLSIRNILNRAARAQIIFSCKPQRFFCYRGRIKHLRIHICDRKWWGHDKSHRIPVETSNNSTRTWRETL